MYSLCHGCVLKTSLCLVQANYIEKYSGGVSSKVLLNKKNLAKVQVMLGTSFTVGVISSEV